MNNPSIDELLKKVHCKYSLSVFAAKRAREILDGSGTLVETGSRQPVTIALEEIVQGKVFFRRIRDGVK